MQNLNGVVRENNPVETDNRLIQATLYENALLYATVLAVGMVANPSFQTQRNSVELLHVNNHANQRLTVPKAG